MMEIINSFKDYIQQNPVLAMCGALAFLVIAGFIIRKLRIIAFLLIICAGFVLYFFLDKDNIGKIQIEDIRKKVKSEVVETLKGKN